MNGWQRIFVVLALVIALPSLGIWLLSKPSSDGNSYAYGCYESNISYVTIKDADVYLRTTPGLAFECKKSLAEIASGEVQARNVEQWWKNFKFGVVGIGAFLAVVYALGWAMGWIWRGFFPKRTP